MHFRITLIRYYDEPKNKLPSRLFFPAATDNIGEFMEMGEARILDVTLSDETVEKLKRSYIQSDPTAAIKALVTHQLGIGSSVQGWTTVYGRFGCTDVVQILH